MPQADRLHRHQLAIYDLATAMWLCQDNNKLTMISRKRKFLVHKVRNHNYGKFFELLVYEIIIRSVQLVGYCPLRGQRFNRVGYSP